MRCYILNPKSSGFISEWITLIPHIKRMKFNTVHLLPITQMGYSQSPYSTVNPFVIDPMYDENFSSKNALNQFEKFVKELKKNDIKLCVDLVFNHLAIDNPMLSMNKNWTIEDPQEADKIKRAGWFGADELWHKWNDLALLNYEDNTGATLWDYMLNYALYWSQFAAQTNGFIRLDNLHSSYQPFVEFALFQIRSRYPTLRVLAELFSDEKRLYNLVSTYNISFLLATQWEHKFVPDIKKYLSYIHKTKFPADYFLPINSHDSGTIQEEYGHSDSSTPRMVCSALLGMGNWGFFQGSEYLLDKKLPFIGPSQPQHFYETHNKYRSNFFHVDFTSTLNKVLENYTFLSYKNNITFLELKNDAVLAAIRFDPKNKDNKILILINFDYTQKQKITVTKKDLQKIQFSFSETCTDILSGNAAQDMVFIENTDTNTTFHLKEAQSLALIR